MTESPPRRAAVYARISRDRLGTELGVDRQREAAEQLIEQRGWQHAGEWVDNNLSGSGRVTRPEFSALLAAVDSGDVQAVVAWDLSRLARNARDRLALVEACQRQGVIIALVKGSDLDPTTSTGRMLIEILGAVATSELDSMRERVQGEKQQAAAAGRYRGSPRPFAYEPDGVSIRADEAEAVRQATERVLAGESLNSVTRWLNDSGFRTSRGAEWAPIKVRRLLTRARNAGLVEREHQDEKQRPAEPDVVGPGSWDAIVTEAQWRQVRRLLTDPRRRMSPSSDKRWLLAGVALCGRCADGTTMRSGATRVGKDNVPSYRCSRTPHLARLAEQLDAYVARLAINQLARPDVHELLAAGDVEYDVDRLYAERAEAEAGIGDVARMVGRRVLSEREAEATITELRGTIDRVNRELDAVTGTSPLLRVVPGGDTPEKRLEDAAEKWRGETIGMRKAIVGALMTVTIQPARPGPGFKPESVEIGWHV